MAAAGTVLVPETASQARDYDSLLSDFYTLEEAQVSRELRGVYAGHLFPALADPTFLDKHISVERTANDGIESFRFVLKNAKPWVINNKKIMRELVLVAPYASMRRDAVLTPFANMTVIIQTVANWLSTPASAEALEQLVSSGMAKAVGNNFRKFKMAVEKEAASGPQQSGGSKKKTKATSSVNPTDPTTLHNLGLEVTLDNYRPLQAGETDADNELVKYFYLCYTLHRWAVECSLLNGDVRSNTKDAVRKATGKYLDDAEADAIIADLKAKGREHPIFSKVADAMIAMDTPFAKERSKRVLDPKTNKEVWSKEPAPHSYYVKSSLRLVNFKDSKAAAGIDIKPDDSALYGAYFAKTMQINGAHLSLAEAMRFVVWPQEPGKAKKDDGGVLSPPVYKLLTVDADKKSASYGKPKLVPMNTDDAAVYFDPENDPLFSVATTLRYSTKGGESVDQDTGAKKMFYGGMHSTIKELIACPSKSSRPYPRFSGASAPRVVSNLSDRSKRAAEEMLKDLQDEELVKAFADDPFAKRARIDPAAVSPAPVSAASSSSSSSSSSVPPSNLFARDVGDDDTGDNEDAQ